MLERYHSIENLPKVAEFILGKRVVITEKIHGTSFRAMASPPPEGMDGREWSFGSRNQELDTPEKLSLFYGGRPAKRIQEQVEKAIDDGFFESFAAEQLDIKRSDTILIYGAWAGDGVIKGVRYGAPDFYAYDIRVNEVVLLYEQMKLLTSALGLKIVPWIGELYSCDRYQMDAFLRRQSDLAQANGITDPDNEAEGVVFRAEPICYDPWGSVIIAKHKNTRFKEIMEVKDKPPNWRENFAEALAFAENNVTEARVLNIVSHMDFIPTWQMQDMKQLVPLVIADVEKECAQEWADLSLVYQRKDLTGPITKKVAALWKTITEEKAFESAQAKATTQA